MSPGRARHVLVGAVQAPATSAPGAARPNVRAVGLTWLARARWATGACQLGVAIVGWVILEPGPLAVAASLALLVPLLASNVWLARRARREDAPRRGLALAVLTADTLALTGQLLLAGGPANPFTVVYLVHVALGALLLDTTWALGLAVGTSLGFATLFVATPLRTVHQFHGGEAMRIHLYGMLGAYVVTAALVGAFVARTARALEARERRVAELQRASERASRLAALSQLAAGAAHELGSPLGTIAVVAREMDRLLATPAAAAPEGLASLAEDARLLRAEAERCRAILAKMSADAGQGTGDTGRSFPIAEALDACLVEHARGAPRIRVTGDLARPVAVPRLALVQALGVLVQNALDATPDGDPVDVEVAAEARGLVVWVEDRGPGIPPDALERLGEPFYTTKPAGAGMGLGLFLVRSFCDGVGGELTVESGAGAGTRVGLHLPASAA